MGRRENIVGGLEKCPDCGCDELQDKVERDKTLHGVKGHVIAVSRSCPTCGSCVDYWDCGFWGSETDGLFDGPT